jgi:hypothetical protein
MQWLHDAEAWLPNRSEVLEVTALMASPVAIDPQHPLMLEGALGCAVIAMVTGRTPDEVGLGPRGHVDIPVPIADGERLGLRVARASQAHGDGLGVVRYVRKRTRTEALRLARVAEVAEYKAFNLPVVGKLYSLLRWCVVGDGSKLERLLRLVMALGRGRQGGLGAVHGWRVRPAERDTSWTDGGLPTRPLPVASREDAAREFGSGIEVARIGYRAPYWHPETAKLCAVPPLPGFAGECTEVES